MQNNNGFVADLKDVDGLQHAYISGSLFDVIAAAQKVLLLSGM